MCVTFTVGITFSVVITFSGDTGGYYGSIGLWASRPLWPKSVITAPAATPPVSRWLIINVSGSCNNWPLTKPGSDRIGSDRIGSDRIGSDRIGSDRIGSDRTGPNRTTKAMFTRDRFQMVPIQKSCRIGLLFTRDLLTEPSIRCRSASKKAGPVFGTVPVPNGFVTV